MDFSPAMKQMFWKIDNESLKKGKSSFLEKMLAMNKNYFLKKGKKTLKNSQANSSKKDIN